MEDAIVLDIEIQKPVEELINGWDSTDLMGVSVGVVWEQRTGRFRIYGPDDVRHLQDRITDADRVTGFNIFQFDYRVIWGMKRSEPVNPELLGKTNDILYRIWKALNLDPWNFKKETHGGWHLDAVAEGTLGRRKTGNGAAAPRWFQQGKWAALAEYCLSDVALERDLGYFIDRYGYVVLSSNRRALSLDPEWRIKCPSGLAPQLRF